MHRVSTPAKHQLTFSTKTYSRTPTRSISGSWCVSASDGDHWMGRVAAVFNVGKGWHQTRTHCEQALLFCKALQSRWALTLRGAEERVLWFSGWTAPFQRERVCVKWRTVIKMWSLFWRGLLRLRKVWENPELWTQVWMLSLTIMLKCLQPEHKKRAKPGYISLASGSLTNTVQ